MLAAVFLKEELGPLGRIGCAICLIGSVIIVLHAPPDTEIETVDEILNYALQPGRHLRTFRLTLGFLFYCTFVAVFASIMIYRVAPIYGKKNPLIYISICSTVGSVSVMSIKGFGIALKLTFAGSNQFTHPSTYVFAIVVIVCILVQMNYFNKALDQFSTSLYFPSKWPLIFSVNPLYYVTFTTATLCASFILFKGFNTTSAINTISLLCGFLVIFSGVYLLNFSRTDPHGFSSIDRDMEFPLENGISAAVQGRRSLQGRRSNGDARRLSTPRTPKKMQEESLLRAFNDDDPDLEVGLDRVSEEEEGDSVETLPEFQHIPKSPRR